MAGQRRPSGGDKQHGSERERAHAETPPPCSHHPLPVQPPATWELAADPVALSALLRDLEPRLMGSLLARRGVDRDMAREACQHVYVLFLTKQPPIESVEHAFRWLNIAAHRQVSKWQRRQRWISDDAVPEQAVTDVVEPVEARLLLEAMTAAFEELRPVDREALRLALEGRERGLTRRERNRVSLHIHRARNRLRSKLEEWWVVLPWARWRRAVQELPLTWSPALGSNLCAMLLAGGALVAPAELAPSVTVQTGTGLGVVLGVGQPVYEAAVAALSPMTTERAHPNTSSSAPRSPGAPSGPLDNHRLSVESPATPYGPIEAGTSPRQPEDDSLLCWGNLPQVPDGCVAHPLRHDGAWITS